MRRNREKEQLYPGLYILGITGGVGAGKSTVLSVLKEEYHAYIIQADEVGHRMRMPGCPCWKRMVEEFGEGILNPDQTINAEAVSKLVFNDPDRLSRLNAALHPLIREEICRELKAYAESLPETRTGMAVLEAALLKEGGLSVFCDEIWYIRAPKEIRIARLMESRGYSRERCENIMSRQAGEQEFLREADTVIENGGTPEQTKKQIRQALAKV